jgi:hypothetical protein
MVERTVRTRAEWMAGYQRVREARSLSTPAGRLLALAADEIRPVRVYVARNLNAPQAALERLAGDEDSAVQWNVLRNVRTSDAALRWVAAQEAAESGGRYNIRRHLIARHPLASADLRAELLAAGACGCRHECTEQGIYARLLRGADRIGNQQL